MAKLLTLPLALLAFLMVAFATTKFLPVSASRQSLCRMTQDGLLSCKPSATTGEFRSSAALQSLCNITQDDLMACKPAITGSKPVAEPSDACCTALGHADLACLCSYKNSGFLPYLGIDPELAMKLPAKCNITSPEKC